MAHRKGLPDAERRDCLILRRQDSEGRNGRCPVGVNFEQLFQASLFQHPLYFGLRVEQFDMLLHAAGQTAAHGVNG
jgi:hypothetical protein